MYAIHGLSRRFCGSFQLNRIGEYEEACGQCEVLVVLSQRIHALLPPLLFYDKREHGGRGLCVEQPGLPRYGIRAGLRVEPGLALDTLGISSAATLNSHFL